MASTHCFMVVISCFAEASLTDSWGSAAEGLAASVELECTGTVAPLLLEWFILSRCRLSLRGPACQWANTDWQ